MRLLVALALMLAIASESVGNDRPALNLVIPVFDAAIPHDPEAFTAMGVFPRIREVEALLWPFALREEIVKTGVWQAVRVVPETDVGADLTVLGQVLESDGFRFGFRLTMLDATGDQWYAKDYAGTTTEQSSGFDAVFRQAAEDLATALRSKSATELETITNTAALRYAGRLAPSAFGDYVAESDEGTFELIRLPAINDPMLKRIAMVRETEFVVEDEIDENYAELSSEVSSIYKIWREYRRQNVTYQQENLRRAEFDRNDFPQASFERFKRHYDVYKWDRQTSQEQDQLALAFDNEVSPILEEIELRVAELEVFVDRKNAEWYRLLEALFELETQLD